MLLVYFVTHKHVQQLEHTIEEPSAHTRDSHTLSEGPSRQGVTATRIGDITVRG
jgi:hypothetical protein